MTPRARTVYAVTDGEFVKVGMADYPASRVQEMQTANARELRIVWRTPGDSRLERYLHRALDVVHVRGEWFDLRPLDDVGVARQLDALVAGWAAR